MENKELIKYGIIALILIAVLYFVNSIFGKSKEEKQATREKRKEEKQLKKGGEVKKPKQQTYLLSTYQNLADGIQEALSGLTEDEEKIYLIYEQIKTNLDFVLLTKAFGERRRELTIGGSTLPQWINAYFSKKEIKKLNGILEKNKIEIRY